MKAELVTMDIYEYLQLIEQEGVKAEGVKAKRGKINLKENGEKFAENNVD